MTDLFFGHGWRIALQTDSLPDGRTKTSAIAHRPDSVHVIAQPTPTSMLLIREFRPHLRQYVWMIPSGKVDKESDTALAAQRELREETGFRAGNLRHYFTGYHSEALGSRNHVYLASDLTSDPLPQDAEEIIEVHEMGLEEAADIILASTPLHSLSALALLKFLRERPSI